VKVLVFGTSDSSGEQLADREAAWPWQAARAISAARNEPVEIVHRHLYLEAPGSMTYFERELTRHAPDAVVLVTSCFSFTFRTVPNRVRRRFGKRAGDWAAARIRDFDSAIAGEQGTLKARANQLGHSLGQKLIGTSTQADYRPVLETYFAAVDRLARLEDTPVVVVGSAQFRGDLARKWPKQERMIIDFNRRMEHACATRRLAWIDKEGMTRGLPDRDGMYLDPVHKGMAYHDGLAAEVAAKLS